MKVRAGRVLVLGLLASILLVACGKTDAGSLSTVDATGIEIRDEIAGLFSDGVKGDATCAELFSYRNDYERVGGSTDGFFNAKLRGLGCFSSSSDRTDEPTSPQLAPVASTAAPFPTTDFMAFLRRKLMGTSYSIESPTTPFGKIQIESSIYRVREICRDLGTGASESQMREELSENEMLGDPTLDRDIPVYVDAVFEAAKTFVCP